MARLDAAFAAIDEASAAAEANLRNARALFDSYLDQVFSARGDWQGNYVLNELCEFIVDCEHKTAPTELSGFPLIRTPNIGRNKLLLDQVYFVSKKTYDSWTRRAIPKAGDLILAREAPAGNVVVIPNNIDVCLGQRTVLIRPQKTQISSHFLAWLLLTTDMQHKLLAHSRGATVAHVNMKDIRSLL
ncbi:MAG: restriction endonuclease subunit S, partial [Bacteroidota bacterium]